MLAQASWMLHFECITLIQSWEMPRLVMHCHDRLFYSFQSRCTWPHCIPDVPISPLTVNRIFPDQAKNPKKGPKLFMESDIKISRTQNIDRSTKGAYTFSSGLGGSQRRRSIMHIIPVSVHKSCLAAFLTPLQEYQSELLWHDDKSSSSNRVWKV